MPSNRISRIRFLQIVLSAIASSSLLTSPSVIDALEQVDDNKIKIVIEKSRDVVEFWNKVKIDINDENRIVLDSKVDDLMLYINSNFDPANASHKEIQAVMRNPQSLGLNLEQLDEQELSRLLEGTVPVAVGRHILFYHRVSVRVNNTKNLQVFAVKWKDLINNSISDS